MLKKIITYSLLIAAMPLIAQAQTTIPLYEKGKVPNAIPTDILVDSVQGKSWLTGNDTTVAVPHTLMPTLTIFTPTSAGMAYAIVVC